MTEDGRKKKKRRRRTRRRRREKIKGKIKKEKHRKRKEKPKRTPQSHAGLSYITPGVPAATRDPATAPRRLCWLALARATH